MQVPGDIPDIQTPTSLAGTASTSHVTISSFRQTERGVASAYARVPSKISEDTSSRLLERQEPSANPASTTLLASNATPTSSETSIDASTNVTAGSSSAAAPTSGPSRNGSLYSVGPYSCTSTVNLPILIDVLAGYLGNSSNTLQATLTHLILNIHAAASSDKPIEPASAPASTALPAPNELLSVYIRQNLSSYLYTPTALRDDRADLNSSWYDVPGSIRPASEYYTTDVTPLNIVTTSDGWPSESYLWYRQAVRLIASFGQVDPQMQNYNSTGDGAAIFPQGTAQNFSNVTFTPGGGIDRGCFFDANVTALAAVNNSWAIVNDVQLRTSGPESYNTTVTSVANLTACGISPFLNQTLPNGTADHDPGSYQAVAYSSIWSWAPGEPRNISTSEANGNKLRCAALDTSSPGRWHVSDCTQHLYAACRVGNAPYEWRISSGRSTYSSSVSACPDNSSFSVPRTGLENSYLLSAVQQQLSGHRSDIDSDNDGAPVVWVNFNSIDVQGCWVSGVNASCPYVTSAEEDRRRTVVVPTVAAVIIFVLAALTLFVKCAANRQNSRRRRRRKGEEGWDYEGVPS